MTPERARDIFKAELYADAWSGIDVIACKAILAACREEREAALTEAAALCRTKAQFDYAEADIAGNRSWNIEQQRRVTMGNRCDDCAQDIEALRDSEPR